MKNNYKYIAMIPARLGSKRIPKKNLRYLFDKPLVQYPIDLTVNSGLFDSIWLNTESDELGRFAESKGINYHKRPVELAADNATNKDFTYEFLLMHECDYVIMVNTTSPLLEETTLKAFIEYVDENDFDVVMSVVSEKAETFVKGEPVNFDKVDKINSQLLEPIRKVVWAITAWKRSSFIDMLERGISPIFNGKMGLFDIPKDQCCDIDTEEDWKIAEGGIAARRMKNTEKKYLDL